MKKKFILASLILISIVAVAYKGISYYVSKTNEKNDEKPTKLVSNEFAINELIAVLKNYSNASTLQAEFKTILIAEDEKTEITSFDGMYIKDNNNLYIQSFESRSLLNERYFIAIDDNEKLIFVDKPEMENKANFLGMEAMLLDIDSLIYLPDSLVFYEKIDDKISKITVEIESGAYYKTEYIYDFKSKNIIKINLFPFEEIFNETPEEGEISENVDFEKYLSEQNNELKPLFFTIEYNKIVKNEKVNSEWFDEKRIFKSEGDKLIATGIYKNYEIDYENE